MPYLVTTQVYVRPDAVDQLAELFESTNRQLVASHDDWLGAIFLGGQGYGRDAGDCSVA